jgi:hypothetical protein
MANKYTSIMPSGTSNYLTPAEAFNRSNTDFLTPGVAGLTTNTSGVAPATGSFAVNAQGTPNMTVAVSSGQGLVSATPTGGNAQKYNVRSDASENVTIAANATGSTVYDFLYIKLDATLLNNPDVTGTTVMSFVTQRSTTQYVDSNGAPANSELIAEITVVNGAASIGNSSITDRRRRVTFFTDGWADFNEVPVYASATTFTCSAGLAAILGTGDKVRLRQSGTDKYFFVTGVSGTTVTINGGTDYTLANATIGKAHFSKDATPAGFPHWFNFNPTLTNVTVGNGTQTGKFTMLGKQVTQRFQFVMGSTSAISNDFIFTLPVTSVDYGLAGSANYWIGNAWIEDTGIANYHGPIGWRNTTSALARVYNAGSTYVGSNQFSSTVPFTWGTGDSIQGELVYEAA